MEGAVCAFLRVFLDGVFAMFRGGTNGQIRYLRVVRYWRVAIDRHWFIAQKTTCGLL